MSNKNSDLIAYDEYDREYHVRDSGPEYFYSDASTKYMVAFDWRDEQIQQLQSRIEELEKRLYKIADSILSIQGTNNGKEATLDGEEWRDIEEMAVNIELNLKHLINQGKSDEQ